MNRRTIIAVTDLLAGLVMVVWVGGHAALGAFAARIAFQELPRAEAARTMTRVFHEFDQLILAAIAVLLLAAVLGAWARRGGLASQVRLGLELGLCALGLFELRYVHARIEEMFAAGRTLEPAFAVMHRLSERCVHGEALLVVLLLGLRAWAAERAS
jgi:hypothetical protein